MGDAIKKRENIKNEIEFLKIEIEQKQSILNEGDSRFFAYIIFLMGLIFLVKFENFGWVSWGLFFIIFIITGFTLYVIKKLRKEIDNKYNKIFRLLKERGI